MSRITKGRLRCVLGMRVAMAGRSIFGMDLRTNLAVAIAAPVLPALTTASTSPRLCRSIATRIEESFF